MNIIQRFLIHARSTPEKTALIFGERRLSYADLRQLTERLCETLLAMGVRQGDVLLVALDNGVAFSTAILAAAELGLMIAPVSTGMPLPALKRAIEATAARFVIASNPVARRLSTENANNPTLSTLVVGRALQGHTCFDVAQTRPSAYELGEHPVDEALPFLLTMTSGSTGAPKPIQLSQEGKIRRSIDGAATLYGLSADDMILTSTPMYHSLGFRLALLPLLIGGTSVVLANFTPAGWIHTVQAHQVSFVIMVSSHLELIARALKGQTGQLPSLRTMVSSSALLRAEMKQRCIDLFDCEFHECYGTSEVGIVTNLAPADCDHRLNSVGRALDYVELRIVDDEGRQVPPGTVGEISCRTRTLFDGYYQQPAASRASVRDDYFHTGDMGYLDAQGYLYLAGRKKDIIIVGGTNVYPEDVEAVLENAPGVRECALIGVPDEYFGEATLAVIVTDGEEFDLRRIRRYCMQGLAEFQQPLAYEVIPQLPRTALGKIQRQVLRDRFEGYDATTELRRMLARRAN